MSHRKSTHNKRHYDCVASVNVTPYFCMQSNYDNFENELKTNLAIEMTAKPTLRHKFRQLMTSYACNVKVSKSTGASEKLTTTVIFYLKLIPRNIFTKLCYVVALLLLLLLLSLILLGQILVSIKA